MLSSVLIANRGEIAVRIIRTARARGMRVIAVYSDADADAPHVRLADEALRIGPAPVRESYLDGAAIIAAAQRAGAACIHPGYGFLSENADFAEACAAAGIVFVGPPPSAIRAMGLKDGAKALMSRAGVPVTPGYHGARQEPKFLKEKAYEIGYPVLIKAVAGGGGKGMRRVDNHVDFDAALEGAAREAQAAFGNGHVLIERYVSAPRHIEIQVFGDAHGNVVHLFERDCSLQRRHQKVIEEAPAPGLPADMRAAMGAAAVAAAKAVGYTGAGTVEFIADGSRGLRADGFFFMEMNTRLQVEHPVTEAVTGLDLVDWQFRVADGEPLPLFQEEIAREGHAVEARLYAEDPEHGFLPSTGRLVALRLPTGDGIRVDCGVSEGGVVTPFYDPMIAKVIAHGATRDIALDRLSAALAATAIAGPRTNTAFLRALCDAPEFRAGGFDTGFIERNLAALGAGPQPPDTAAIAHGAQRLVTREAARLAAQALALRVAPDWSDPWDQDEAATGRAQTIVVEADGLRCELPMTTEHGLLRLTSAADATGTAFLEGDAAYVLRGGRQTIVRLWSDRAVDLEASADGDAPIVSPMHGKLIAMHVEPGDMVVAGQVLAIVEAMKMEHALTAPRAGLVEAVLAQAGAQVALGARLIVLSAQKPE